MSNDPVEVDALERYFEDVIKAMDIRFTSHEFYLRLAHDHQREYVAGLAAYSEGGYPFKDLHHALSKRLRKLEGELITKGELSEQGYLRDALTLRSVEEAVRIQRLLAGRRDIVSADGCISDSRSKIN
jgi:hypothetical protein